MSKRMTTRWYIGAWVVAVLAAIAMIATARSAGAQVSSSPSAALFIESFVAAIAGIVMLVMLIGALVKLGMQRAFGWFVAILLLHIVGLGIVGMAAYAVAGPEDEDLVVTRPPTPI